MKRFVGILLAAAALVALTACGGGNDVSPPVVQHPENKAIWSALGGDSAAPAAVAGVVNAAVRSIGRSSRGTVFCGGNRQHQQKQCGP